MMRLLRSFRMLTNKEIMQYMVLMSVLLLASLTIFPTFELDVSKGQILFASKTNRVETSNSKHTNSKAGLNDKKNSNASRVFKLLRQTTGHENNATSNYSMALSGNTAHSKPDNNTNSTTVPFSNRNQTADAKSTNGSFGTVYATTDKAGYSNYTMETNKNSNNSKTTANNVNSSTSTGINNRTSTNTTSSTSATNSTRPSSSTSTSTKASTSTTTRASTTTKFKINFDYVNDFAFPSVNQDELNHIPSSNHQCESQQDFLHWKRSVRQRVLNVQKQCDTIGAYINPSDPKSDLPLMERLLVDTKHKTIYCNIPKVASKNWRRVFLTMLGIAPTPEQIEPRDVYSTHGSRLDKLANYDSKTVNQMLRSFRKILFVRDPFERLVSAYLDKFTRDYESCNRLFGDDIRKFRRNGTNPEPQPGFNDTVLFDEFVRFVTSFEVSTRKTNEHWATYTELCRPCLINYTIIGKLEEQQTDVPCTLRLMLTPQELLSYTFPNNTKLASNSRTVEHFSALADDDILAVWKHFENDLRQFGYVPDHYGREKFKSLRDWFSS